MKTKQKAAFLCGILGCLCMRMALILMLLGLTGGARA